MIVYPVQIDNVGCNIYILEQLTLSLLLLSIVKIGTLKIDTVTALNIECFGF